MTDDPNLEMIDHLFRITADIANRLVAIERLLPTPEPGEARSDYRFENYAPTDPDPEHRAHAAWTRLHTWVDWLVATYRLTTVIPPCWPEHPTITEELIALRTAWLGAWKDTASPDAITTWHERLARAKTRLADGNWGTPRCPGTHDGTGLDMAEQHQAWLNHPSRYPALDAAHNRSRQAAKDQP